MYNHNSRSLTISSKFTHLKDKYPIVHFKRLGSRVSHDSFNQ